MPDPEGIVDREVTATPAQFERDLRATWPAVSGSADAGRLVLTDGPRSLQLELRPGGMRRIGLLELPRLMVRYRFGGGSAEDHRRWLAILDRGMQKGGG